MAKLRKIPDFKLNARTKIAVQLQKLETDCYNLGMFATARKLNAAIQESGREITRIMDTILAKDGKS